MKRLLPVATLLGLTACAPPDPLAEPLQHMRAEANACRTRVAAMPSYIALKDKLPPLDNTPISMALQMNEAKPTPADAALLLELHAEGLGPCRQESVSNLARASPTLSTILAKSYAAADQGYVRLAKREISWGAYATEYSQQRTKYDAELAAALDKIRNDAEARRAAAAAIPSAPIYRPVSTYCTKVGISITCNSY